MFAIDVNNLNFSYLNKKILNNINIKIPSGSMISIVGPNGSGKSTFLKVLSASLRSKDALIHIDNQEIKKYDRKTLAKKISILSQCSESPPDITVHQLVNYGRYAFQNIFNSNKLEDENMVYWALKVTELTNLSNSYMNELSGGQRQRAWIAMALAQNSSCLFLDELTTYLDIRYQIDILNLLKKINFEQRKTIIMVHHDLNHAIHYSNEIIVLQNGEIIKYDNVNNIIKSKVLDQVFKIKFHYFYDKSNIPYIFY